MQIMKLEISSAHQMNNKMKSLVNSKKSASELIGFITITLIAIIVIGATFFWTVQLIEKNKRFSTVQYSEELSTKISENLESVLEQKTQKSMRLELKEGQLLTVKNTSILLSNKDAFSDSSLSGTNYLRGNSSICNSENVSIGQENLCIVSKLLSEFEIYFVDTYDSSENTLYKVEFEIDKVGSAAKGSHYLIASYNGISESSGIITQKIKINIE